MFPVVRGGADARGDADDPDADGRRASVLHGAGGDEAQGGAADAERAGVDGMSVDHSAAASGLHVVRGSRFVWGVGRGEYAKGRRDEAKRRRKRLSWISSSSFASSRLRVLF